MTEKSFRPEQARVIADAFEKHVVDYLFIGAGGAIIESYDHALRNAVRVENFPVMSIADRD